MEQEREEVEASIQTLKLNGMREEAVRKEAFLEEILLQLDPAMQGNNSTSCPPFACILQKQHALDRSLLHFCFPIHPPLLLSMHVSFA